MAKKLFLTITVVLALHSLVFHQIAIAAQESASTCNVTCVNMKQIFEQSSFVGLVLVENEKGSASGTGAVVKIDGVKYILTNNHVVEGASSIWISFYKHSPMYEVSIVGRDPAADLALLTAPFLPASIGLITFGKTPEIGEEVYALGYPFEIRSVTVGNINALESVSWLYLLMQAPVNPGNSGGPLFNSAKEMVGVNTAMINTAIGTNMNFVLPINYVKMILPRLVREKVVGHGDTDFVFSDVSGILPSFFAKNDLPYPPEKDGVMVVKIEPDSPSKISGICEGDTILKFNGFVVQNARELDMKIFFEYHPDDEITLTTQRGSQIFERHIKLGKYISPFSKKGNNNE